MESSPISTDLTNTNLNRTFWNSIIYPDGTSSALSASTEVHRPRP